MTIAIVVLLAFVIISSIIGSTDSAAGRVVSAALATIQKPFVQGADWLGAQISAGLTDEHLRAENESMKAEIEDLQEELAANRLDETELEELRQLREILGADLPDGGYTIEAADILVFEGSDVFNFFTIGAGTETGVLPDTVVIAGNGLVGRVLEANTNSSKVTAIIDENNRIGFAVEGRKTELGICYGDGGGGLTGEMLDDQADVRAGDRIVTSGLGGIYPAGILIGTVTNTEHIKEDALLHVEIATAVDFKRIKKVALLL